ncbi:MAG: response regulator [Candidatus Omnitrophica bacterium]|nr:response regulator [Candidatus Omnitrophota bacterium]
MPERNILLLEKEESPWPGFLGEFFSDTRSGITQFFSASEASPYFSKHAQDIVFINDALLSPNLIQKLKTQRQISPDFRIFAIQTDHAPANLALYDAVFTEPLEFLDFQKKLMRLLSFPEKIRVLMIDDEPEVSASLVDFLKERTAPAVDFELAPNGAEGLAMIQKRAPDVLILDVKMPVLSGIETYRELKKREVAFPVIIHFDAVFGDEVVEIHKIGNPAVVEKGGNASSVFDMMALILKMHYFA